MLKNPETYEIMSPETIGLYRGADDVGVVMGKHSGRNALGTRLKQLGFDLGPVSVVDVRMCVGGPDDSGLLLWGFTVH